MKRFFFFFIMLTSITANATVTVTPLSADYATRKVTFRVAWTGSAYNNRVWVWVDLCPVTGTTAGTFAQAVISAAAATAGSIATVSGNTRGFYVTTNPSTVTATLSNASGKFNWCAYGSDYPPNATINNGTYTLKGSPSFIVNGNTTLGAGVKTYSGGCITSLTDATGCPGLIPVFSAGSITTAAAYKNCYNTAGNNISVSINPSGGDGSYIYQWTVSRNGSSSTIINGATGATYRPPATTTAGTYVYRRQVKDNLCNTNFTLSAGTVTRIVLADYISLCGVSVKMCDAGQSTYNPGNLCPSGWRWPSVAEACCMSKNIATLNFTNQPHWTGELIGTAYSHVWSRDAACDKDICSLGSLCTTTNAQNNYWVRCVR